MICSNRAHFIGVLWTAVVGGAACLGHPSACPDLGEPDSVSFGLPGALFPIPRVQGKHFHLVSLSSSLRTNHILVTLDGDDICGLHGKLISFCLYGGVPFNLCHGTQLRAVGM